MTEPLVHQRENDFELESHLKDNGEKFNRQCVMVLEVLYHGGRWTAKRMNDLLDIADSGRRLRDLHKARRDVKREWVYTEDGKKTRWKEYWIDIPKPPTKDSVQKWWDNHQKEAPVIIMEFRQGNLFND